MQQETIERIRGGDLDAYEAVVRQYQGILLGYAAHRLPDIDTVQDVVQLTFIRAFEQLDEYQSDRDFGVWLCVICKHFILTELERQRRESRNLENYGHALRIRVGQAMADVDDSAPAADLSALRECVTRLHHGILTARIPEPAIGFTVETSAMDVVDLGTAFGVSVNADGVTDVSVFEGSVEVRPQGIRSDLLLEGEAVRGGGEGKPFANVQFDSSTFERAWPVALGVSRTTGSVRFVRPGPPWDLTEHRDDNDIIVFPEAERIQLREPVGVDSVQPGELLREQTTAGHAVASGTTVRSYLLQFNPATRHPEEKKVLTGEIAFSHPIAGVIWNADRLAQTDAIFGAKASQYEFPGRGIETPRIVRAPGAGRDRIFLSEDRCTLNLKLNCSVHLDQIRVLVETD